MATWEQNKDYILGKVADGTADAGQLAWYKDYVAAGSPETQVELQEWKSTNTGVDDGVATYWNPDIGMYQTDPVDDWKDYKAGGDSDYSYYVNSEGVMVYGKTPDDTYNFYDGDGSVVAEGQDPFANDYQPPSIPGMAEDGGQFFGDPTDEGNTGNIDDQDWYTPPPETSEPWAPYDKRERRGWTTGEVPDDWTPPNSDPWTPVNGGAIDWGGGAVPGIAPVEGASPGGLPDNPLIGWEASSNKDFYQQQFKDMRDRREGEMGKEFAAAIRAENAQNAAPSAPTDPWAWAGGSEQFTPQVAGSGSEPTWNWNSALGDIGQGSTNSQILDAALGIMPQSSAKILGDGYNTQPDFADSQYWGTFTDPSALKTAWSRNNRDASPEWANANFDLFNTLFTRSDLTTPEGGGPTAAPGYALPVGTGG